MTSNLQPWQNVAALSWQLSLRQRTVAWLSLFFAFMVAVSAYLGWSANHTVNLIYTQVVAQHQAAGLPMPGNPLANQPHLALLRNLTTYVSLLGALAAMVAGFHLVHDDIRAGVLPLIRSRATSAWQWAGGKFAALVSITLALTVICGAATAVAVWFMPGPGLNATDVWSVVQFHLISELYLLFFGAMAMAAAAHFKTESMGLLIPLCAWLVLTFVMPQVSANINPMSALNPIKAMQPAPTAPIFDTLGHWLAPVSVVSMYRELASSMLGLTTANQVSLGSTLNLSLLGMWCAAASVLAVFKLSQIPATRNRSHV